MIVKLGKIIQGMNPMHDILLHVYKIKKILHYT